MIDFPFRPEAAPRSFPSAVRAGSVAVVGIGRPADAGADGRQFYPVANRTAERNRRVAVHEVGHCIVGRALGSDILSVTIIADDRHEGKCLRRGPPANLNLLSDQPEPTTARITEICERLASSYEMGSARVEHAEHYLRAQGNVIELLAGSVCEEILFPHLPPLAAEHDQLEAAAFARAASATPGAVDAMLQYARTEANGLIRANLHVVNALVESLIERGTLTGEQIDQIIMHAVAADTLAAERRRRAAWAATTLRAAAFKAATAAT